MSRRKSDNVKSDNILDPQAGMSNQTDPTRSTPEDIIPPEPQPIFSVGNTPLVNTSMTKCMVRLTRLTDKDLKDYTKPDSDHSCDTSNVGGYSLRKRKSPSIRLDRDAKYNIHYTTSIEESSDDTYGKCKPVKHKFVAALSGPSTARIAAQR